MIQALRYTEELVKVGFSAEQAKKSVQVWMDLMDQNFATKADFLEHSLKTEIALKEVRAELKQEISELHLEVKRLGPELTVKLGIMMTAAIGIVSTIITLLK